jgi:LysR family glycine cleavage system transcriptional activator
MSQITHLKSLQALDIALREGSLKAAASRLGITSAAVGQRIRALEDYLETDLLVRGRSGLQPTRELLPALADLRQAFDCLDRTVEKLDFQRVSELHIVADPDWAELWLDERLPEFRADHPNIRFCINGVGDVPLRLGAPDLRITLDGGPGEPLFRDVLLPVTGPDNPRRIAGYDPAHVMEGMPLLHLTAQRDGDRHPGWVAWFDRFGHRARGQDRGIHYSNARLGLEAVRSDIGFLICGLSLVLKDLARGAVVAPFPMSQHLVAPDPYRMSIRSGAEGRPAVRQFASWVREAARVTQTEIDRLVA